MRSFLLTLSALATFTAFTPAMAQDQTAPAEGETQAPAETPTDGAATEDTGPKIGDTYVKETHGDWDVRCIRAPLGQGDPCQMFQLLKDADGNAVAEASVTPLQGASDAVAKMNILTPIGTLLPPGIKVSIDGREIGRLPFMFCSPRDCTSEVPMKAGDIQAFKAGGAAELVMVPAVQPDATVPLTLSLKGYTAAFDALPKP